jgi:hypothetical protein
MIWVAPALAASLFFAVFGEANRSFRLPGAALNVYRGAVPVLLLSPWLAFVEPPAAWQFYALTAMNGLVISYSDARLFDAAARFGGAQTLRLQPLVLVLVFVLWAPLDWPRVMRLVENPPLGLGVVSALCGASLSLYFMTRTPVTLEALRFYLPAILAGSLIDPINKLTTRYAHGPSGALCYAMFTSFFVLVFVLGRMTWMRRDGAGPLSRVAGALFQPGHVVAGLTIGCLSVALNFNKTLAMAAAPNPAFVTAIIFCSGLWATAYARLRGQPDDYNPAAAATFIFSAVILLLLASEA